MEKMDPLDLKILRLLQQDARMTIKEIASQLKRSTTPIFERIKRLEKRGIIDRYVAILNQAKLGKKLTAFIHISLTNHSKESVEKFVGQVIVYPEIMECYHITGGSDFLLKVVVEDIDQYNKFVLDQLSTIENIGKLETRFTLSIRKHTTELPLMDTETD